jgi:hypothetical protein
MPIPYWFRPAAVLIVAALAGSGGAPSRTAEAPSVFAATLAAASEQPVFQALGAGSTYQRPEKVRPRVSRSLPSAPATPRLRPVFAVVAPFLPGPEPHARPDRGPGVRSRPPPRS